MRAIQEWLSFFFEVFSRVFAVSTLAVVLVLGLAAMMAQCMGYRGVL